MYSRTFFVSTIFVAGAGLLQGQYSQMKATYKGGGDRNHGKCTVDLVVDAVVDVEIRGDTAYLRSLSGQPARGRRFECTGPIPARPGNFHFDPQEGRGRQSLIRDPRDGGPIVVRIEDPQGGSEGYKFDFYWDAVAGIPDRGGYDRGQGYGREGSQDNGVYGYPGDHGSGNYPDQNEYHRDRDQWQGQDWHQRLFDRVRQDLEHVQPAYRSDDDRRRFGHVMHELNEMQEKLAQGRYDRDELDDVIESLQRVVRENRLSRRDGQILSDDLDRLRDFRSRHDEYGAH